MGAQKHGNVGESQSVLIKNGPTISPRTRRSSPRSGTARSYGSCTSTTLCPWRGCSTSRRCARSSRRSAPSSRCVSVPGRVDWDLPMRCLFLSRNFERRHGPPKLVHQCQQRFEADLRQSFDRHLAQSAQVSIPPLLIGSPCLGSCMHSGSIRGESASMRGMPGGPRCDWN
jgi:hypothetical protein